MITGIQYGVLVVFKIGPAAGKKALLPLGNDYITVGQSNCPDKIFKKVDFPAPFAPMSP